VVEAGGYYQVENGNNSVVPLNSLLGLPFIDPTENFPRIPLIDWQLLSTPQAGNRRIHYAQGKTLGGSSAINSMAYIRGTAGSYQWWADIADDQSYTFPNLLKYFKKSVHLTPPDLARRNAANATPEYDPTAFDPAGGPLRVSWNKWVDPSISWLAKALQTIVPINPIGVNSGVLNGAAWVTSTISPAHAYRESSQTSFLEYAIKKTGLIVYTHSQAAKILFDDSKKATNVSIFTQGVPWTLTAKKEIILSAGIFHSPQLLMVSGMLLLALNPSAERMLTRQELDRETPLNP
jgi:choline dehydrogenase